ncbi:MAG: YkgJ family cysteine cluster protein [Deltaproteobacteria bacterium]|nr:YkgJ family cysteine cluster protein [Deltaproteobacteria bacterium]
MIETLEEMGGSRLAPHQELGFTCRPGLACFGACCRDKRLPLWPYDSLRLGRALGLAAEEFLATWAELEEDPRSGWPALRIKLTPEGICPFLGEDGCRVYADRPACCRIYPLAWAVAAGEPDGEPRQVYLRVAAPGCLGWDQAAGPTVAEWVAGQGLLPFQAANLRLLGLLMHPARRGRVRLTPPQTHAYLAALYNPAAFRPLVADPAFAARFGLPTERVARALADDEELIHLGQDWLAGQFFGAAAADRP